MANILLQKLRDEDVARGKKANNYFDPNASVISYSTGFPVLDYYLGYKVNVYNEKNEKVDEYPSVGITAGSYVMFIGKPSTSKTATAVKIAANIVRPFENGFVEHYDIEQAMNYSRIQALTKFPMNQMGDKYILQQEKVPLEDMKAAILRIYHMKTDNPDAFKYNTGKKNEFNQDIILYEPTVVILDSIASITEQLENEKKEEDIGTQTDRMRLTGKIGRFFNDVLPYLKEANIILIAINQIKTNPGMGIVKSPAEMLYLKQDEALPGGKTPQFLAHILIRFNAVTSEKYTEEDDGFGGFKVRLDIIKSRVSQAGRSVNLIYDKNTGVDMVRSTVDFLKDVGLVGGNRAGYYFEGYKEDKFKLTDMVEGFKENPILFKHMHELIMPILTNQLSGINEDDLIIPEGELDFYNIQ